MVQPDWPYDNIARRMSFACWINMATNTHSEYVILIFFFLTATKVRRTLLNVTFVRNLPTT